MNSFERIRNAIKKYQNGQYNEAEIQATLNAVISTITEAELLHYRDILTHAEGDLERVNFMIDEADQRNEYLKILSKLEIQSAG